MYEKLITRHEGEIEQRKCSLLQEFFSHTFKKDMTMSCYISELENLVFKLKSLNHTISDDMMISKILSALPEKYKHFASAWESTSKTEKTLGNLTARLIQEENRIKESDTQETVAFNATNKKCFRCNKMGHIAPQCKNKGKGQSSNKVKCGICKKTNHSEKDCYFRKNKNEANRETNRKDEVSFLTDNNFSKKTKWIVDSGSTSHLTNDKNIFTEVQEHKSQIKVAKKSNSMEALGIGKITAENCTLNNVLYVPDVTKNLLSVNAVTENGGEIKFSKDKVEIYSNNEKVLEGQKENGLYTICLSQGNKDGRNENAMISVNGNNMWHRKLAHLGKENMIKLQKLSTGMSLSKEEIKELDNACEDCIQSKQTRLPFNSERKRAERPGEIIHSDVCGPINPVTWDGKKYFITFLDDYTHHCQIELLETREDVQEVVKEYIMSVEAKWNSKVSKFRCDNGGEYINNNFKGWCKKKGIVIDYTVPYSPQLNGKAERLNRTIMEKARALIADSRLDKEMWGEAVRVAAYLTNRSPTSTVETTPHEMWTKQKPNLARIKLFGCDAYAKILTNKSKLDNRSEKLTMVGYTLNGYRLWNNRNKTITIHRDVVFDEKKTKLEVVRDKEEEEEVENTEEIDIERSKIIEENVKEVAQNSSRTRREIKVPKRFEDYVLLTYEEAVNCPDKNNWLQAIEEEKQALEKNETWTLVDKEEVKNKRVLSNKWIFKVKNDGRYKARLVLRGYEQRQDFDYDEIYSLVLNATSLRIILALVAAKNLNMVGFDI